MEPDTNSLLESEFLQSLDEKEYKSYLIAKDHLGSSFDLVKSNAYLEWLSTRTDSDDKLGSGGGKS